jgi:hypothetical protein
VPSSRTSEVIIRIDTAEQGLGRLVQEVAEEPSSGASRVSALAVSRQFSLNLPLT